MTASYLQILFSSLYNYKAPETTKHSYCARLSGPIKVLEEGLSKNILQQLTLKLRPKPPWFCVYWQIGRRQYLFPCPDRGTVSLHHSWAVSPQPLPWSSGGLSKNVSEQLSAFRAAPPSESTVLKFLSSRVSAQCHGRPCLHHCFEWLSFSRRHRHNTSCLPPANDLLGGRSGLPFTFAVATFALYKLLAMAWPSLFPEPWLSLPSSSSKFI